MEVQVFILLLLCNRVVNIWLLYNIKVKLDPPEKWKLGSWHSLLL